MAAGPWSEGRWLRPPQLRTVGEETERHATWLELFFDLVLVAAVGQLAASLAGQPTATGFARYAGLFVPVAWAWMGFTFYANRFDTDDFAYRLLKALAMLAVVALAIEVRPAMAGGDGTGFALAYVGVRLPLLVLYARAAHFAEGLGRSIALLYLGMFTVGAALWLVSVAVPGPWRYALWGAGLLVDFAAPPVAWRMLARWAIHAAHITERFGGFFIIVLGEAVIAVVSGTAGLRFGAEAWAVGAAGMIAALALWWIYFDLADTSVLGRGLMGLVFVYGHLLLFGGVAALGAGVRLAVRDSHAAHLPPGVRWALCGGACAYLVCLALLHAVAEWTTVRDRALVGRLVLTVALCALAAAGGAIAPVVFMALLAGGLVAQLALELLTPATGAASAWAPG